MSGLQRKALMAAGNYWNAPFPVGSHHIARSLVKNGFKVAFISDPISPFHAFAGITPELRSRYKSYKNNGIYDLEDHVWSYVPGALFTPHNKPLLRSNLIAKYAFWGKIWGGLIFSPFNILILLRIFGLMRLDLIVFSIIQIKSFWLDLINYKNSVYRIADRPDGFLKFTDTTKNMEKELAAKVDTIIYTANTLKSYVSSLNPNDTWFFPNGVNYQHFVNGSNIVPGEFTSIPGPIALYVGAMDFWFDFNLVNYAAKKLPKISFVLIGPDIMAKSKIEPVKNIYILGSRAYDRLPGYLHNANVGIIPFNVKGYPTLINSVNPLKLYEYMACGLPVVSMRWKELEYMTASVFM